MPSVEQEVKQQFARLFRRHDWALFKKMADHYFMRAVFLRTRDIKIARELRLLARNSQKRLFIGIGTELLLKAIYLKNDCAINKQNDGQAGALSFPFTFQQAAGYTLAPDKTYMLNDLIEKLGHLPGIGPLGRVDRGLRIAKVFRNKEGHVVLPTHKFDASNYRDIEVALMALYSRAFGEALKVRFSFAHGQQGEWEVR